MNVALIARVLAMRRALRGRERWSQERLVRHRDEQLALLRKHARERSRFYRRFHAGCEGRPLSELPVLTKAQMMNEFDELVTDPRARLSDVRAHLESLENDELLLGRYRVTRTSGSTGSPAIFLSDPREWAAVIASYARCQEWAGIRPGLTRRTRLAVVSSRVPWHQSARVGTSMASPFLPVRRFDATEPLQTIVAGLNAWQPENLVAYASMARLLAAEQLSGRLRIAPRAVMTASEVLTAEARARIRRAWGREPFDVYAATETAAVASECARHRRHFFEDMVIAEIVDEQNRTVPAGEAGAKLLVTVLFSRTQPLIRYEMSDRAAASREKCDCGLPFALLEAVEGRAEEVLLLPARDGGVASIHPNVFHGALESLAVEGWQVLEEPDAIRVLLARPAADVDLDRVASAVTRALREQGATGPKVQVERVESVQRGPLGKAPLIKTRDAPDRA